MANILTIKKVLALPAPGNYTPNTLYILKDSVGNKFDLYMTDALGLELSAFEPLSFHQDVVDIVNAISPAVKMVTSKPLLITGGRITTETPIIGDIPFNVGIIFLDVTEQEIDFNGNLLPVRDFLVEDRLIATVAPDRHTVVFTGDMFPYEGKYAQVSYLTYS